MMGGILQKLLGRGVEDQGDEPMLDEPAMHGDEKILQLKLKKKNQINMLKRMLADAGYGDLAKMTTISKHDLDDEGV